MLTLDWQLQTPLDAIFFDCDGTLSQIEGIDALAAMNGVETAVKQLTSDAMGSTGVNPVIYRERLLLTQPREDQMKILGGKYVQAITEDAREVVAIFQRLQKKIFILSAGLLPAIRPFADYLKVPKSHVYAVDILFDEEGNYLDFDKGCVLIQNRGKRAIVQDLVERHPRTGYIGDGLNDCPVQSLVTRFVGYGGAYYRENIASQCDYYISVASMAAFLPLTLTAKEQQHLEPSEETLYQKGLLALQTGGVKIRQEK